MGPTLSSGQIAGCQHTRRCVTALRCGRRRDPLRLALMPQRVATLVLCAVLGAACGAADDADSSADRGPIVDPQGADGPTVVRGGLGRGDAAPQARTDVWGPLAVVDGPPSGRRALVAGTLRIEANCVTLEAANGRRVLLVWPSETTAWDGSSRAVLYGRTGDSVALADGDPVSFGGGSVGPKYPWPESPDGLASAPHPSCPTEAWFVGDLG